MYSFHSCPGGQPLAEESAWPASNAGLVLHLRESRSILSQEARVTFTILIGLFMAMAILPAIKGEILVPLFALGTMALLVGGIEWHQRSQPAAEWLTIEAGRLQWRSNRYEGIEPPESLCCRSTGGENAAPVYKASRCLSDSGEAADGRAGASLSGAGTPDRKKQSKAYQRSQRVRRYICRDRSNRHLQHM